MIKVDVLENGSLLILERTVSDSVKFEKIKFSFPERWKDFVKTAVFRNGETVVEILLNSGSDYCTGKDECFVPYEVIKPPFFTVSVFGSRGDTLATTTRGEIEVSESGYELGDAPKEPTQSIYAQILDETEKATRIAQSVRDDADSGKFKGEKGDRGETGNGGTVDLVYNPESENAQSGKAVAEALKNEIEIDGLIESLKEQNNGDKFTFWVGTQAEYDAIEEKVQGCFYIITDDNSRNEIVAQVLNSQKDYVVEQGTSGVWTYRKWASGIAECWGEILRTTSNWGVSYLFSGGGVFTVVNEPFPFEFTSVNSIVANSVIASNTAVAYSVCSECLVKQSAAVNAHSNHTGEQICQTTVIVKGRWK